MKTFGGSIVLGLILAVGLSGCSQEGGTPSVPAGASNGEKADFKPEKTKAGPRAPQTVD